ncbi:MAG: AarF/ABC1/UbiB kinase family protein [Myxococcales bacterium]|nr:AarF/ABC1/UbiB kinase family protein [Myxococcales bacterium]
MPSKWEKLAGETGEEVPSGRLGRMFKLGSLGLTVGASAVAGAVGDKILPGSDKRKKARAEKNAERVVKVLGRLKGASMKVGQIISADPEMVPDEFADILSSLQSSAPPMTYNTVRAELEAAFDMPLDSVFKFFDPEPIGSASIGQVHRGTLHTGEDVAVKIQYPGVAKSLESDLKNLGSLMGLTRAVIDKQRVDDYVEECRRAILEEADYTIEAANLERAASDLGERPQVRVPKPFREWTRSNVITMEFIEGRKLDEALAELGDTPRRQEILERFLALYVWMFHERFELHSDPHPGNFLLDQDDNLVVLDFGCVKVFEPEFADGILKILVSVWEGDDEQAARLYKELGFGKEGADDSIYDPDLIHDYHDIILAPFTTEGPFSFGDWRVQTEAKRFFLSNPKMLKLTPPKDALLYFRVLSAIKGLFMKLDAQVDTHHLAVETARRRGLL